MKWSWTIQETCVQWSHTSEQHYLLNDAISQEPAVVAYFRKNERAFKICLEIFCSENLWLLVSVCKVKVRHSVYTITTTSSTSTNSTSNNQRERLILLEAKFKFLFSFQIIEMSFEGWGCCSVWKALAMQPLSVLAQIPGAYSIDVVANVLNPSTSNVRWELKLEYSPEDELPSALAYTETNNRPCRKGVGK